MSKEIYKSFLEKLSDTSIELLFKSMPLNDIWCKIRDEYLLLVTMAVNVLPPLLTTYFCKTVFSTYVATKTKYHNRLDAEPDIRLQNSSIESNIIYLMTNII